MIIFTICCASAPSLSSNPGVSIIVSFPSHPKSLPFCYEVKLVHAFMLAEVLKISDLPSVSPYKKALQSELFPVPVFPMTQSVALESP